MVPFARVEELIASTGDSSLPLLAKQFRQAFVSRSANNAGFLVAVLRAEGLLGPAPETANQQIRTGDWDAWKAGMLSEAGEPYQPMPKAGRETHLAEPSRANNGRSNTKRGSKAKSNSAKDGEGQEEGSDESDS